MSVRLILNLAGSLKGCVAEGATCSAAAVGERTSGEVDRLETTAG